MARVRVKVCGVRDADEALIAIDVGADAIGFHFTKSSPRYIDPAEAYQLMSGLPPFVTAVAVFHGVSVDEFADIEEVCPTPLAQLDGDEPEYVVRRCGPGIIRSIRGDIDTLSAQAKQWGGIEEVDAILLDLGAQDLRVAGELSRVAEIVETSERPVFLRGPRTAESVSIAIREIEPYGIDFPFPSSDAQRTLEALCAAAVTATASPRP